MKAILEILAGPAAGARFDFVEHDRFLVGRSPEAHLQLAGDPHFSRNHFLLEFAPPNCFLRDLGSVNGTYVNDERVSEAYLKNGDTISGGQTRIRFTLLSDEETGTVEFAPDPSPGMPEAAVPAASAPKAPPAAASVAEDQRPNGAVSSAKPQVIGHYEILQKIGEGGMGVVYLARHKVSGQQVALKVIVPESSSHESKLRRFLREANVLSKLEHPRIVKFLELNMAQGQLYFVMEYVPTVDLHKVLADRSDSSRIKALCGVACQVLEALRYAHARSFVHRDIKPANILVAQEGKRLRTRLADFGLAKNFEHAGLSGMTCDGQALGTVAFMAPEQITQSRDARPASDIYAVAATLYYYLTQRYAYVFRKDRDPFLVLLEDKPVPIILVKPDIPPELAKIIDRGLARDPQDRFPSANAMWKALLSLARGGS